MQTLQFVLVLLFALVERVGVSRMRDFLIEPYFCLLYLNLNAVARYFSVCLPDGTERQVSQLQTENWPDLTAPDDPR